MKVRLKPKIANAIQWKGWPHKIKGIEQHPGYPQLGSYPIGNLICDVYPRNWIVKYPSGETEILDDFEFHRKYELPRNKIRNPH